MVNDVNDLAELLYNRFSAEILSWDEDAADIYAIALTYDFNVDDYVKFLLCLNYNTTAYWRAQTPRAGEKAEAKWNLAFWPDRVLAPAGSDDEEVQHTLRTRDLDVANSEIEAVMAEDDYEDSPDYERLLQRDAYILDACVTAVQRLHESGIILARFGHPVPVLILELDSGSESARLTAEANPPGVAAEFEAWAGGE